MHPPHADLPPAAIPQTLLGSGIKLRLAIAAAACGLLWLAVFWALT